MISLDDFGIEYECSVCPTKLKHSHKDKRTQGMLSLSGDNGGELSVEYLEEG